MTARLPTWRLLLFSLPALPAAVLLIPVTVHLPTFYAGDMAVGLGVVGAVLFATRLWDVAVDPAIGALSDRRLVPWGRRRPWLLAGTPMTLVAVWLLFRPPAGVGWEHLLIWTLLLYLGWSMMVLPYGAWAAELSTDYHERARIAGFREAIGVLGTLVALVLPFALGVAGDPGATLALLALFVAVTLPPTILAALVAAKEPPPLATGRLDWRAGMRGVRRNGPFVRLLIAFALNGFANGLPPTLFLLFVGDVLKAPDEAGPALLIYFAAGVVAVPFWVWLARKIGKHRAWIAAMLWACAFFVVVPFLGPGDAHLFMAICVATGLSFGADLALPAAMQADVIDIDTARTGSQRTGFYLALWTVTNKATLAVAVGVAFPILELAGFARDGASPPLALTTLALLYGGAPVLFKLAAIMVMRSYPLTAARHSRLMGRIAARRSRAGKIATRPLAATARRS